VCVDEHEFLRDIEKLIKKVIDKVEVPGFAVDPTIKPEPVKKQGGRGRGGNGGGRGRGNSSGGQARGNGGGNSRGGQSSRGNSNGGGRSRQSRG